MRDCDELRMRRLTRRSKLRNTNAPNVPMTAAAMPSGTTTAKSCPMNESSGAAMRLGAAGSVLANGAHHLTSSSSATAQENATGCSKTHTSYARNSKVHRRLSRWLQRLVRCLGCNCQSVAEHAEELGACTNSDTRARVVELRVKASDPARNECE